MSCPDIECPYKKPIPLTSEERKIQLIVRIGRVIAVWDLFTALLFAVQHKWPTVVSWVSQAVMWVASTSMWKDTLSIKARGHTQPKVCPLCGDEPLVLPTSSTSYPPLRTEQEKHQERLRRWHPDPWPMSTPSEPEWLTRLKQRTWWRR